jgi:hypothetical protein
MHLGGKGKRSDSSLKIRLFHYINIGKKSCLDPVFTRCDKVASGLGVTNLLLFLLLLLLLNLLLLTVSEF